MNGDQVEVDWYVVRCSQGNLSFIVSILITSFVVLLPLGDLFQSYKNLWIKFTLTENFMNKFLRMCNW